MKVTKKQKDEIYKHLEKISKMCKSELIIYAQKWYMAKQDLDETVFKFVQRGLDIQLMYLQEVSGQSALAVCSDFSLDSDEVER